MEESDKMLITSLSEFITIPDGIDTLRDFKTEHIFIIVCNLFETLGIDYQELKSMNNKTQRFRAMTKLTQLINSEMDGSFELNEIMNPSPGFLRKLIISMISKIGASEVTESKNKVMNMKNENNKQKYEKRLIKEWVNEQWILPELDTRKKHTNQSYRLKIGLRKDIFKRNLVSELTNVPGNAHSIIQSTITHEKIERKKKEADEGITRKENEEQGRNIYQIIKNNQNDWNQADKKKKKIKKNLAEKTEEAKEDEIKKQVVPDSVFQQEVKQIASENKKYTNEDHAKTTNASSEQIEEDLTNPLQRIKRQCENKKNELERRLQEMMNLLNERKMEVEHHESMKKKLEEQLGLYEERIQQERERRPSLKKEAQKMKILMESIQAGQSGVAAEVKQLQQQFNQLRSEAEKQIKQLRQQIQFIKSEGQRKLTILRDVKMKLAKIELDYQNVTEEIQQKQELKSKVKISKSGISRIYYSKKISEMEVRWRQTQKEANKILKDVQKQREQIRRLLFLADRSQIQIDNMINSSKFKDEPENKTFKDVAGLCKKSFNQTVDALEKINVTKADIQEYEAKVHSLSGKQYAENIKKISHALQELTKEINAYRKKLNK